MVKRVLLPLLLLAVAVGACSVGKPPDELFQDSIRKMVMLDRELGFREEVTRVEILGRETFPDQVAVRVRVEGWATHPELTMGATLPAEAAKRQSWAVWKFFCRRNGKVWEVTEKFRVEDGFF